VIAVFVVAGSLLGAASTADAGASPFLRNASIGVEATWDSARDSPSLSLDAASITVEHILAGKMPESAVVLGRQTPKWGHGLSGSLLLSGFTPLDALALSVEAGSLRYSQLIAARDVARGRWLLAHRLEGQIAEGVEVGVSEACAVSSGFRLQPYHLLPGCPYFLDQHLSIVDERSQDWWSNVLAAVDASVEVGSGVKVYGEFMADDFPWAPSARGKVPYMVAGLAGVQVELPSGSDSWRFAAEYVRVNNYVYSHKNPENTYVVREDEPIGHPLGPDADALYVFVTRPVRLGAAIPFGEMEITGRLGYERHGEGALGIAWNPSEGVAREFLSGTIETRASLGLWARAGMSAPLRVLPGTPRGTIEFAAVVESLGNADHVPSARAVEASVRLSMRLMWNR
jgi:hypothetical protein